MRFESERSTGALVMALLAVGVLALGWLGPWLSYDSSTGRQTPEGGYHDPSDTGIERHAIDMGPFKVEGDVAPSDPERADQLTTWMGYAWLGAGVSYLLMAIAEIPPFTRFMGRTVSLLLCLLAFAGIGIAAWLCYYELPATLSGYGIREAFTYELVEPNGYYRSNIGLAWAAPLVSVGFGLGAFAFKFAAGSADPSAIEQYSARKDARAERRTRKEAAHAR